MPLLRLDVGRLFSSLVGSSEARTRETISRAESMSPCILWIDEIDMGFVRCQERWRNKSKGFGKFANLDG